MKLLTIEERNGQFIVTDYYQKLPTSPYKNEGDAINLCRSRLGKFLTDKELSKDKLYKIKVPFINLWLVW